MEENRSLWQEESLPDFPVLEGDTETEVLIIGGGLCGILTAYTLWEKGIRATVIEAEEIGGGVTARTTGKVTAQHGFFCRRLTAGLGEGLARQYAAANRRGMERLMQLAENEAAGCDIERLESYAYVRDPDNAALAREEAEAALLLGFEAEWVRETELPFSVAGAVCFHSQGMFHPLKFLNRLTAFLAKQGVRFYAHTRALPPEGGLWRDGAVRTNRGVIGARTILLCTHFPFLDKPGWYFARIWQERTYLLALQDAPELKGMYIGYHKEDDAYTFRPYRSPEGNGLLFGGRAHKTGHEAAEDHFGRLQQAASSFYPGTRSVFQWSAQDCMTHDGIPYIGAYRRLSDRVFLATGFNKWGMSSSMVAAELLADAAVGEESPYSSVFSPGRFDPWLKGKSFFIQSTTMLADYIGGYFQLPKDSVEGLKKGQARVVDWKGERVGVYRDDDDELYTVRAICTHLGCPLVWNTSEKTWDCPCHGSRYDIRGHILNTPASQPLAAGPDVLRASDEGGAE